MLAPAPRAVGAPLAGQLIDADRVAGEARCQVQVDAACGRSRSTEPEQTLVTAQLLPWQCLLLARAAAVLFGLLLLRKGRLQLPAVRGHELRRARLRTSRLLTLRAGRVGAGTFDLGRTVRARGRARLRLGHVLGIARMLRAGVRRHVTRLGALLGRIVAGRLTLLARTIFAVCDPGFIGVARLVGDPARARARCRLGIVLVVGGDASLSLLAHTVVVFAQKLRVGVLRLLLIFHRLPHRDALPQQKLLHCLGLLARLVGLLLVGLLRFDLGLDFGIQLGLRLLAVRRRDLGLAGRVVGVFRDRALRVLRGSGLGRRLDRLGRGLDPDLEVLVLRLQVAADPFGEAPELEPLAEIVGGSVHASAAQQMHQHRGRYPQKQRDVRVARHFGRPLPAVRES